LSNSAGEALLSINFDEGIKNHLIAEAYESVFIVQEVCYHICVENDISETQKKITPVVNRKDILHHIYTIIGEQKFRYQSFLTNYSRGFANGKNVIYSWILIALIKSSSAELLNGLSIYMIRDKIINGSQNPIKLSLKKLSNALILSTKLQAKYEINPPIIEYNSVSRTLRVVDRHFIMWLAQETQDELLDIIDY